MKKKIKILDIAIVFMVIIFGIIVYFKVIKPSGPDNDFNISNPHQLNVLDLNGDILKWQSLLPENEDCWVLILEMSNCNTCIFKGVDDLKALKAAGKNCFVIVVHDIVNEAAGWSGTFEFSPFYMMRRADYYEHISSMVLPVLVRIKGKEVRDFRYITF